eukprot:GHVQ01007880.1.p1 GENE.GHVQ01007880.1~~GHVQ01007880.1.p1  ORF type:complete len:148 (-),score=54.51 GHVQ01007880.1:59-502(-)
MRSTRTTSVERNPKRDDNQSSISSLVPSVSAFFADSPSSVDPSFSSSSSHYSASTPTDRMPSSSSSSSSVSSASAIVHQLVHQPVSPSSSHRAFQSSILSRRIGGDMERQGYIQQQQQQHIAGPLHQQQQQNSQQQAVPYSSSTSTP